MRQPLKVLFLRTMNSGVAYLRMWQFKEEMNRQKIADVAMPWFEWDSQEVAAWQFHVNDDPRVYARTGVIPSLCAQADVVVVQYLHSYESLALIEALKACLKDKGTVFLTEIDDYVLDTPVTNAAFQQYQPGWKYREIILEQMRALDGVIVSTPFLKDAYSEFSKHIYVVENSLDLTLWDKHPNKQTKELRIGWMGGDGHQEDLRSIEAPLKQFLKENSNVFFYCVCGVPDFFKNQSKIVPIQRWFRIDRYPKAIAKLGFDIGLAPLVDNNFTRGKSNLRKLEYGALGIPVIAADVGHFAQTVQHGKDGFLYRTPEEFKKALETLAFNKPLRQAMGRYNRADIKRNYNTATRAQEYVDVLRAAHERGQTTTVDVRTRVERSSASKWIAEQPAMAEA